MLPLLCACVPHPPTIHRDVTLDTVEQVWVSLTRTNSDGKLSIRDLRQWYISFGRRVGGGGGAKAPPPPPPPQPVGSPRAPVHRGFGVVPSPRAAVKPAPREVVKPLYAWEGGGAPSDTPAPPFPLSGVLEVTVRITAEEFAGLQVRRRAVEAESRYRARQLEAKARAEEKRAREAESMGGGNGVVF